MASLAQSFASLGYRCQAERWLKQVVSQSLLLCNTLLQELAVILLGLLPDSEVGGLAREWGMACLWPTESGPQLGRLEGGDAGTAGHWGHLEAWAVPCLDD